MKKSTVKKSVKKVVKPKEAKLPKFWILWGPASHKPPTKRFHSRKHAEDVAEIMVNKHGGEFYVLESSTLHKKAAPPVLKLDVTGEPESGTEVKDMDFSGIEARVFAHMYGSSEQSTVIPPRNHGNPWSYEDKQWLVKEWRERTRRPTLTPMGTAQVIKFLSAELGRSPYSIYCQLKALTGFHCDETWGWL